MKDTQGNPITEEEFMKDIGHGVGIKLEEWESEFENLWNEKKGVIDWQTPDNQIKSFIKEERYKGYEEGRDDGFKEGKNAALSEVSRWIAEGCAETDTMVGLAKFLRSKLVKRHE